MYSVHSTLYTVKCTLYTIHCTLYPPVHPSGLLLYSLPDSAFTASLSPPVQFLWQELVEDLGRRGLLPQGWGQDTPLYSLAPLLVNQYILPRWTIVKYIKRMNCTLQAANFLIYIAY